MAYFMCLQGGNGGGDLPRPITANGTVIDFDVWHCLNAAQSNLNLLYSDFCLYNGSIVEEIFADFRISSAYEGFCFLCKDGLNLTVGNDYILSFDLEVSDVITFDPTRYKFGIKHTATQITNFSTTSDLEFVRETGTQHVNFTFTAAAANYFSILLSAATSGGSFRLVNLQVTPAT